MREGGWSGLDARRLKELLKKYYPILIVLAAGAFLLLLPQGDGEEAATAAGAEGVSFDLEALEERMERALSQIEGAGEVSLVLTVKSGVEQVYAVDTEYREDGESLEERSSTVLVAVGSGLEEPALVRQDLPVFQGALVVCDGGDDPAVRLLITRAVAALTGLGADKIAVCK